MWNFKGTLCNSPQNILPILWKTWFLYNIEISRALRFKSSYVSLKWPPELMECQLCIASINTDFYQQQIRVDPGTYLQLLYPVASKLIPQFGQNNQNCILSCNTFCFNKFFLACNLPFNISIFELLIYTQQGTCFTHWQCNMKIKTKYLQHPWTSLPANAH